MEEARIIEKQIYEQTDHGLDIIRRYFPNAEPGKKFKVRQTERTPSAALKLFEGKYYVKDFGDDGKALNAIDLIIKNEGLNYYQAINREADRLGLTRTKKTFVPIVEKVATTDPDGISHTESTQFDDADLRFWGVEVDTLLRYGWAKCTEYVQIKNGNKITVKATDGYRMYVRNCNGFYKIYKPFDSVSRFMIEGEKPDDFLHGLREAAVAHATMPTDDNGVHEELPYIILCSGERDAMVAAEHGYHPVWKNSETEKLSRKNYLQLKSIALKIVNIPDADVTGRKCGRELALSYIDIYTADLPQWLSEYSDNGKKRKDLRDFHALKPGKRDFDKLLESAKRAQFWDIKTTKEDEIRYQINDIYFFYFLSLLGFYKIVEDDLTEKYVYISGNIIEEITHTQIKDKVMQWLESRGADIRLRNATFRYIRPATILQDLQTTTINIDNYSEYGQFFQFRNKQVHVTPDGITEERNAQVNYWKSQIINHDFKRLSPAFTVENDFFKIENMKSHFFRYLINTSRIYWREEYENRTTGNEEIDKQYRKDNQFNIAGERLSSDEAATQQLNLINKIYSLGYIMHRYKAEDRAFALWVVENKITRASQSNGGSGKSFMFESLKHLLNIMSLNGRDDKLMDNKHVLDRVKKDTHVILIEDAEKNLDFNFWYPIITNSLIINEKNKSSREIPFKQSPKIAFTSNYAPCIKDNDSSSFRRLLFVVMSDYYHKNTRENEYKEDWQISDDFGYRILCDGYKEEYYNEDFNFLMDCLQFYLTCCKKGIKKIEPDISNILKRIDKQNMGDNFEDWADLFFASEDTFNRNINKNYICNDYQEETGVKVKSMAWFKKQLATYCNNHNIEINPEFIVPKGTRNRQWDEGKLCEHFYFRKK